LARVCRKKSLRYPSIERELLNALKLGLTLDIQWVEVDQVAVVELAVSRDLTTYDASFLWVSRTLGIPLLTFDEQLRAVTD
jgi:predicted nucleic acid-binding protein